MSNQAEREGRQQNKEIVLYRCENEKKKRMKSNIDSQFGLSGRYVSFSGFYLVGYGLLLFSQPLHAPDIPFLLFSKFLNLQLFIVIHLLLYMYVS